MKPLERIDGYLPIEDHGLIGDGATAALVGRNGKIVWLCLPRFDSPAIFCSLLDADRGGHFSVTPEDLQESRQFYEPDSPVLVTEMKSAGGLTRLTDSCPLRAGADLTDDLQATRGELLRSVKVLFGEVRLRIEIETRGGAEAEGRDDGLRVRCAAPPQLVLRIVSRAPLKGLRSVITLKKGESLHLILRWRPSHGYGATFDPHRLHSDTTWIWKQWLTHLQYDGPQEALVRRSAITMKLLDHFEGGAIVAAPTSSLPEHIGGVRNWDYRYAWVRDAALSVYALHRIGLSHEAAAFLSWVLDAVEREGAPRIMYTLDGNRPPHEVSDPELEGYRRSNPVRWGNAAADQHQHDVCGEILDCAYQWTAHHGSMPQRLWRHLCALTEAAGREWRTPDHGIWEVRTSGRPFTYSAALCQVALDRAARMGERFGLAGPCQRWRQMADDIRRAILEEAWDAQAETLTEHLGGGGLDASLLALPLRRVVPADHPKMVATTRAICDYLGAGKGLLYRYRHEESPDGIPGREGAFLLCSFWLVDNFAKQGRVDEAMDLYDSLCARAGHLGLLPEEIDPTTGSFLGNYPQAFSHIGVIASGVNLGRACRAGGRR
ncbi:MAG TPA: glycoside hydrolase family 15 protein [Nitrospira sp.]|nr:glycoside hydrolase family 15 protein [Nitrospira sp.]